MLAANRWSRWCGADGALLLVGILAVLLLVAPGRAERLPLPPQMQEQVNNAVDFGVLFLKKNQLADGSWPGPKGFFRVGFTALPALTLLECGESATDPGMRKALESVRAKVPDIDYTYELALSIMLLDRAGDPKDKEHIQTMALRLIAGQRVTGGWRYRCPKLGAKDQRDLLTILGKMNPRLALGFVADPDRPSLGGNVAGDKKEPGKKDFIPLDLRALPVLQDPNFHRLVDPASASTDNSNTQFAILGLAVAHRHDVPITRTMKLVVRRFETSQDPTGGWEYFYRFRGAGEKATMDCAGLIGLAVAHAVIAADEKAAVARNLQDPRIVNGLVALSRYVGKPSGQWQNHPQVNRYFLWSLERVGVLFDLPRIGESDWYRWGAEILLANQQPTGNWGISDYPLSTPIADTCMALLFLKKANLVKDLAGKLPINPEDLARSVDAKLGLPQRTVAPPSAAPDPSPPLQQVQTPKLPETTVSTPALPTVPLSLATVTPPASSDISASSDGNQKLWAYLLLGVAGLLACLSGVFVWHHVRKKQTVVNNKKTRKLKARESPRATPEPGLVEVETVAATKPARNGERAVNKLPARPKPKPLAEPEHEPLAGES